MDKRVLSFRGGCFSVMQLTDIHYTHDDEADHRTLLLMRELIAAEKPGLIVLTGDTVYGERNAELLAKALSPVTESGIPWAFLFGNHDVEFAGTRGELFSQAVHLPGCVSYQDPESGTGMGNCMLELRGGDGRLRWVFACIDSGDYNPVPEIGGYGCVTRPQTDWYQGRIAAYEREAEDFSAMVFQHIPLPEHDRVWHREVCYGIRRENVCCPNVNTGFFSAVLEAGHTRGIFAGHDHVNDYWGRLYGVALGYGRCTGFGSYGAQDFSRGCRMFRFREEDPAGFETYVRLENGVVVDEPWVNEPDEK